MINAEVITVIRSIKSYDELAIEKDTRLIENLGFTSMDIMNLILTLEQRFKITFQDQDLDLDRFITFGALLDTLENYNVGSS